MTDIQINRPDLDLTDLPSPAPDSPVEALGWLGDTADEVAEGLRLRGIKGKPSQATTCPLATYLKQWWEVTSVFTRCLAWNPGDPFTHDDRTPNCYLEFARQFDQHRYPDLIA